VSDLLGIYHELCTQPERSLLNKILFRLREKRLALLLTPQREFTSMGLFERVNERVDFAFEVPPINGHPGLKLVLEVDGDDHAGAKISHDSTRDNHLKAAGWKLFRFPVNRKEDWGPTISDVVKLMESAIPSELINIASRLRDKPEENDTIIRNLILLPQAEGRLLQAIAQTFYEEGVRDLTISDQQNIGLSAIIDRVNLLIEHIWNIHGEIPPKVQMTRGAADFLYFAIPCHDMWDALISGQGVIGPASIPSVATPFLLKADQRK